MADEETPHSLFETDDTFVRDYIRKRVKESGAPITDATQFGEYMTSPTLALGSKYHLYVPKEIALGNLSDEETKIVYAFSKVINSAIYLADKKKVTEDLPNEKGAQFVAWLNATRGKGMAHEKLMVEQNIRIHKTEETKTDKPSWIGSVIKKK